MLFLQWSSVHKAESLPTSPQRGEGSLPPILQPVPVKKEEKDSMIFTHCYETHPLPVFLSLNPSFLGVLLQALSPVRLTRRSSPQIHTPNPATQQLSDKYNHRLAAEDGQPVFSESWPSTDCGSSPASTAAPSDMERLKHTARAGTSKVSSELGVQQDSVLAKYALVSQR